MGKGTRRPQAAKYSPARNETALSSPPHPPPSGAPIPIPSVALRHLPLIRGVGPPRGRLWGEIAPSSVWPDGQPSFQKGKAFDGEGPSFVPGGRLEKCGGK